MQKKKLIIAMVGVMAVIAQEHASAAGAFDLSGTSNTTGQSLGASQNGTIESGGSLTVSGSTVAVTITGTNANVVNNGTIAQTGTGRGVRETISGVTLSVTNNANALIQTASADAIQVSGTASNVTIYNAGTISSLNGLTSTSWGGNQAIDLNGITAGTNVIYNYATGVISAANADSVRPGVNGTIYNDGTIISTAADGTYSGTVVAASTSADGIDAQTNSGVNIVNAAGISGTGTVTALIEGSRHGITGGNTDTTTDGTYTMTITNNAGGTIKGDDGSGINIDGFSAKEVVTIVNHGLIQGNGITGDGDGVDVDGLVNLTNTGTIVSTQSLNDVSEGVTVGGGTINNSGTILGENINGGTSRGITLAGVDKDPTTSVAIPTQAIYANTTITNSGLIRGTNGAGIGATGEDASAYSIYITNMAEGTIEGGGTIEAAIFMGNNNATIINYGNITADASGTAIDLGTGANSSVQILGGTAVVNGNMLGNSTSSLTITPGSGNTFTYADNVSGFGTLDIGAGTTTLNGVNAIAGLTTVDGKLLLGGASTNSSASLTSTGGVVVSAGGTLGGYGTVIGNVTNNGVLSPGGSTGGTLTIDGNYSQGQAATLLIGVADGASATGSLTDTGYGRLVVTGSATIASGSAVTLQKLASYAFAAGQRYVVVDAAASGTNYNASSLVYSIAGVSGAVLTGSAVANGSNSDLVVTITSLNGSTSSGSGSTIASLTSNSNASSALKGLTNYSGISNANLLNLYDASLALTGSEATSAGKQLAPTSSSSLSHAAASVTFDTLSVVGAHADSLRLADAGLGGGAGGSGVSTGDIAPAWGVWGQAFGGHASQSERDGVDGYSANYGGMLFGIDRAINDAWRAGGVLSYSNAAVNNTGATTGNTTRVQSVGLIGYATYTAPTWYSNLMAGVVQQRYATNRLVDFTGFSGNADGNFGGMQYVAKAEFGYPLAVGNTTVTPLASLTYSYLHQNAYAESGGNGAALAVGATHATSVKSELGVKFERAFSTSYGTVVPDLKLAWRHEYDNTRVLSTASFTGDPTGETSFTTLGARAISDTAVASAGITLMRASNLSITARYEVEAASGYLSQAGSIRLRQLF